MPAWWDNIKNSFFGAVSDDDVMSTLTNPDGSVTTTYRNGRKTIVYPDGRVVTTGGSGTGPGGMIFILLLLIVVGIFGSKCRKVGERRGADGKMHPIMDCSDPKPQQPQMYIQPVPVAYAPVGYAPTPVGYAPAPVGYAPAPVGYAPAPPRMGFGRRR